MKTDFLRELGIEQEAINKIMAENGKDIEALKAQVSTLKTFQYDFFKNIYAKVSRKSV